MLSHSRAMWAPQVYCSREDDPDAFTCTILPQVPPLHLSLPTIWKFSSHPGHISRWTPLQDKDQIRVSRHKCYLVPFLAILCLCEDMVSAKEKKVADVLIELPAQRYSISRRKKIFSQSIASWLYVLMPYGTIFGTRRSCLFFKLFHYTLWFLTEPVMCPQFTRSRGRWPKTWRLSMANICPNETWRWRYVDAILIGIDHYCRLSCLLKTDLKDINSM